MTGVNMKALSIDIQCLSKEEIQFVQAVLIENGCRWKDTKRKLDLAIWGMPYFHADASGIMKWGKTNYEPLVFPKELKDRVRVIQHSDHSFTFLLDERERLRLQV